MVRQAHHEWFSIPFAMSGFPPLTLSDDALLIETLDRVGELVEGPPLYVTLPAYGRLGMTAKTSHR